MKASIKFREEQMPLIRAKIPLNVLSLPFQSGVVAGETEELSLNLSTYFDAGPAFKFVYRPNDSRNPFSFICKTGIGNFGSPISSPFTMSAEFNFVGNQNPSFFLHFKPKFGDFSIKKSHSSAVMVKKVEPRVNGGVGKNEETPLVKHGYAENQGFFSGAGKIAVLPAESAAVATGVMEKFVSGAEVKATTVFPLGGRAVVNLRWWLRFPSDTAADREEDAVIVGIGKSEPRAGISFGKFPTLLMDKISIEHVAKKDLKGSKAVGSGSNLVGSEDVTGMCLEVKKQLEVIESENGLLRKALNDLRSEIAAGNMDLSSSTWDNHGGNKSSGSDRVDRKESVVEGKTKAIEADGNRGLKNATKGAN